MTDAQQAGAVDDDFPPYDERNSVVIEAAEVPAESFEPAAADFDSEYVPDGTCGE